MSAVDVDIEHTDLDTDDDGDDDTPITAVYVSIITADGMRYAASSQTDGSPSGDMLADMVIKAAHGAGATHSAALGTALKRWR